MNFSLRWIARALTQIRSLGDPAAELTPLAVSAAAYDARPLDRTAERRFRARLDRASIDAEKEEIVAILHQHGEQPVVMGCVITLRALHELVNEGRIVERTENGRFVVSLPVVH